MLHFFFSVDALHQGPTLESPSQGAFLEWPSSRAVLNPGSIQHREPCLGPLQQHHNEFLENIPLLGEPVPPTFPAPDLTTSAAKGVGRA